MSYLVLAYPALSKGDFEKIQEHRKVNDERFYSLVNPHFTLVFAVDNIDEGLFVEEISDHAAGVNKIDFVLRCATVKQDSFSDYYHTFLVPEEGYSRFVKLHDQLYSGQLKNDLRLDLEYVPHISIGNSKDKFHCKKMVNSWNEMDFAIKGSVNSLTLIRYDDSIVTVLKEISLN